MTKAGWNTDTADFARAVAEFEAKLPGFWWSVSAVLAHMQAVPSMATGLRRTCWTG